MRDTVLNGIQIGLALLLIITIVLQQRGSGIGGAFGGEGAAFQTKRGIEKTLFIATIVLSALFLGVALANVLLR